VNFGNLAGEITVNLRTLRNIKINYFSPVQKLMIFSVLAFYVFYLIIILHGNDFINKQRQW